MKRTRATAGHVARHAITVAAEPVEERRSFRAAEDAEALDLPVHVWSARFERGVARRLEGRPEIDAESLEEAVMELRSLFADDGVGIPAWSPDEGPEHDVRLRP